MMTIFGFDKLTTGGLSTANREADARIISMKNIRCVVFIRVFFCMKVERVGEDSPGSGSSIPEALL